MSYFCLNCLNEINETNDKEIRYVMSDEPDYCYACRERKYVVMCERKYYGEHIYLHLIYKFGNFGRIIYCIRRVLVSPFLIFKESRRQIKKRKLLP